MSRLLLLIRLKPWRWPSYIMAFRAGIEEGERRAAERWGRREAALRENLIESERQLRMEIDAERRALARREGLMT